MRSQKNAFDIEKLRDLLAKKQNYKELRRIYKGFYPEINDKNTSRLWDQLNLIDKKYIIENPMELERLRYVVSLIEKNSFDLLNIGFGSANLEKEYFRKYTLKSVRWFGIDISEKSVNNAKKIFPQCFFKKGNILKIKENNSIFDYVISLEVLEHIKPSQIFTALNEIKRILKSKGYFILSVPLNEGLEEMISHNQNPNAHVRIYTEDLIKAELEITGFIIIKTKILFAFHKFYKIKTFIAQCLLRKKYHPNNIIILAQKP